MVGRPSAEAGSLLKTLGLPTNLWDAQMYGLSLVVQLKGEWSAMRSKVATLSVELSDTGSTLQGLRASMVKVLKRTESTRAACEIE